MASIRKRSDGRWQVQIARKGVRKSKILDTRQQAKDWAAEQEHRILVGPKRQSSVAMSDVFKRYAREVSPKRRGERWESLRLNAFAKSSLGQIAISDLTPTDLASWRDARLCDVAPGTVNREMTLISAVLTVARREWLLIDGNPMSDVRKPSKPPPRDRRPTPGELEALAISAGDDLSNATARAFHAFRFAIETAMRAGEIVGLTWANVHIDRRFAHLPKTKNGTSRDVPLSQAAIDLLEALPKADPVFDLTSRQLDVLWRKLRDRAGVEGLTFHDSRHEGITRLARKLDVLDLARMVGHRDIRQLQTYYNATASEIAGRLD